MKITYMHVISAPFLLQIGQHGNIISLIQPGKMLHSQTYVRSI
jgi:hypothetical protein